MLGTMPGIRRQGARESNGSMILHGGENTGLVDIVRRAEDGKVYRCFVQEVANARLPDIDELRMSSGRFFRFPEVA